MSYGGGGGSRSCATEFTHAGSVLSRAVFKSFSKIKNDISGNKSI